MCVILVGKIGFALHSAAKEQNPDGFSLFTKELGLVKSPSKAQVSRAVNQFGIWHYRIRSSGAVDHSNIHPFPVAQGKAYLYHNGVISGGKGNLSDTACLAGTLLESPLETVQSVLQAVSSGQRFLLADATDPTKYWLYGDWKVDQGIIMSHKMYTGATVSRLSTAQKAGWVDVGDKDVVWYGRH